MVAVATRFREALGFPAKAIRVPLEMSCIRLCQLCHCCHTAGVSGSQGRCLRNLGPGSWHGGGGGELNWEISGRIGEVDHRDHGWSTLSVMSL